MRHIMHVFDFKANNWIIDINYYYIVYVSIVTSFTVLDSLHNYFIYTCLCFTAIVYYLSVLKTNKIL